MMMMMMMMLLVLLMVVVVVVVDVCVQEDEDGRADVSHLSDVEDNIPEQTHHIIIPSYTSWFNYNRSVERPRLDHGIKGPESLECGSVFTFRIMIVLKMTFDTLIGSIFKYMCLFKYIIIIIYFSLTVSVSDLPQCPPDRETSSPRVLQRQEQVQVP